MSLGKQKLFEYFRVRIVLATELLFDGKFSAVVFNIRIWDNVNKNSSWHTENVYGREKNNA